MLKVTVAISMTFSLGDVNHSSTMAINLWEVIMSVLSALWAYVRYGVAFLWSLVVLLPHARGGVE